MSQSKLPMVDIILPYKEHFSDGNAGAVSTIAYSLGAITRQSPHSLLPYLARRLKIRKKMSLLSGYRQNLFSGNREIMLLQRLIYAIFMIPIIPLISLKYMADRKLR